jgi:hypothetical protein
VIRSSAAEIVSRVTITQLAIALELKVQNSRCVAAWRGGTHFSVSLNEEKGCFFDHVVGQGGGKVDLVQLNIGGDRKDAIRWIAESCGVQLTNWSSEQRKQYVGLVPVAERLIELASDWGHGLRQVLDSELQGLHQIVV